MTEKPSDIEAELASLQPRELSAECMSRIDEALCDSARSTWRVHSRRLVFVAAVAAAIVIAAAIYWSIQGRGNPGVKRPMIARESAGGRPCASLAMYRQAAARGPGAVDALLDGEAAASLRSKHDENLVRAGLFFPNRELIP